MQKLNFFVQQQLFGIKEKKLKLKEILMHFHIVQSPPKAKVNLI